MVGRYPAIQLMPREPIRHLVAHFSVSRCRKTEYEGLVAVSAGYPSVTGRLLTRYAPFRRSPSKSIATLHAAPRLACVKPAASVHPEPGSNSPLLLYVFSFFFCPAAAGARPLPIRERWGAGAVPGRIDKGKPKKGAFPCSSLFYSSRRMMSMCQARSRKREGTAKLARRKRPCNSRADFFQAGPEKKRLPPFAVAKVLPATLSFQILSQLFLKKINSQS